MSLEPFSDPLHLARRLSCRGVMASSYDRRGGNHDWSNYIRREGRQAVMMEAEGPGCITRIWTADPQKGAVRIFIDGEIRHEMPFRELFGLLPLTFGLGGESPENYERAKAENLPMGFTSYCPIPFRKSCKVTIEPEDDYLYYQINANLYPPRSDIQAEVEPASLAIERWTEGKPLLEIPSPQSSYRAAPGEEQELFASEGSGYIKAIRIKLPSGLDERTLLHVKQNLWIVAHFDDDEARDASVRAPLGAFFLDYGQSPTPRSLYLGTDSDGEYYCFFAMPFRTNARIKLVNQGIVPVELSVSVLAEDLEPHPDLFRFRATWHVETPLGPDHRDYEGLACRLLNLSGLENIELLYVQGGGHFVGCGFSYDLSNSPTDRAAGEGDEMFFIDDDPRLTMYGTGLEDYTNDAWGMSGFTGPLAGDAKGEGFADSHLFGYRLHISDPVPFTRKGRFTIEHGTGNNCSGEFQGVAYWYMDPAHARTRVEERRWEELRTGKRQMNQETDEPSL